MSRRYAAETRVSVDRSEAELKKLLRQYGADTIMTFDQMRPEALAVVAFAMNNRNVKLSLPLPDPEDPEIALTETGKERKQQAKMKAWEQACRARWRLLVQLVRMKLEAVAVGATTFDREFLADMMVGNASSETFIDVVRSGRLNEPLGLDAGAPPPLVLTMGEGS